MDVISVLIPLLESRTLSVPAHGNAVKASPGFQLFATQRSYSGLGGSSYQVTSASSAILDKLWTRVQIEPLSKEELTEDTNCSLPHDKRLSSTRDFMKWCSRIAVTACGAPTLLDSKDVFLEAQDCFSAPLPKTEDRNLLDMAVGAKLGLTKRRLSSFLGTTNQKSMPLHYH
ncbi:AAA ATPase midasin [Desmophyllum pertusum]|uniref:AAA ATPase midasin n=1 Tax=Desmophyllum pertusum TaxID=174260 RepID=A0A9W9ZVR7_9CNID|nr:AAA ATPase midasin [Desmophyllum pertusum]